MPTRGNPPVQARVPQELYDAFRAKAGSDLSQAVRQAITDYVGAGRDRPSLRRSRAARRLTRPERLERVRDEVRTLLDEYAGWQSNLPDFAAESATAERLAETLEQLGEAADLLDAVEPPRGFGRD